MKFSSVNSVFLSLIFKRVSLLNFNFLLPMKYSLVCTRENQVRNKEKVSGKSGDQWTVRSEFLIEQMKLRETSLC